MDDHVSLQVLIMCLKACWPVRWLWPSDFILLKRFSDALRVYIISKMNIILYNISYVETIGKEVRSTSTGASSDLAQLQQLQQLSEKKKVFISWKSGSSAWSLNHTAQNETWEELTSSSFWSLSYLYLNALHFKADVTVKVKLLLILEFKACSEKNIFVIFTTSILGSCLKCW